MKLKAWLAESGMSATKFAELAELSRATVYRVMRDKPPDIETAIKIEDYTRGLVKVRDMAPAQSKEGS